MMEDGLSLIELYVIPWSIKLLTAVVIFVLGKFLAHALTGLSRKAMAKSRLDPMLANFFANLMYTALLVAVILAAIDGLGVNITSLLAIVGAAGLAIGLALKDSLSNFAAGIMIIIFRPFKTGDFITAGGSSGVVDEIGLFCTLLHTGDNQRIIMANASVFASTIINASALPTRRIDLVIGISYDDNIGQARDVIRRVIQAEDRILADPAPVIAVAELADSSVNLNVRPWVNTDDYWAVRGQLIEDIKGALDQAGITIPYPQRDVHMHAAAGIAQADGK
ncbi:MAG: mechanosensitive ion channel [Pseudomonadales bacterium]|nr:mechanosensitive ion channel [Pseudomonadales bacterium]